MFLNVSYFAVRIHQVTKDPGSGGTCLGAGREFAFPGTLHTKSAFLHFAFGPDAVAEVMLLGVYLFLGNFRFAPVKSASPVWAGCHAIAAADTPVIIDHNNAVRFTPCCLGWACFDTGCIFTLETLHPHVKFIVNRDLVEKLSVTGGGVKLAGLHLKYPDILCF